ARPTRGARRGWARPRGGAPPGAGRGGAGARGGPGRGGGRCPPPRRSVLVPGRQGRSRRAAGGRPARRGRRHPRLARGNRRLVIGPPPCRIPPLLSIPGAFHLPRALLPISRTSSVRSRTFVLLLVHGDA